MKPYTLVVIGIRLMAIFLLMQQLGLGLNLSWPPYWSVDSSGVSLTLGGVLQMLWAVGAMVIWVLFIAAVIWFAAAPLARWMVRRLDDTPVAVSVTEQHLIAVLLTVIGAYTFIVNLPNMVTTIWLLIFPPGYLPSEHMPTALESWTTTAFASGFSVLLGTCLVLLAPRLAKRLVPVAQGEAAN